MSTKDRKLLEKENRREAILRAAEKIMLSNGLYGLSIDLIAAETQLAKGTIYLYFKSKEEILSVLTIRARHMLLNIFEEVAQTNDNPIDKLKSIIRSNYVFYKKYPLYYDLVSLYEGNNKVIETEEMLESSKKITELVSSIAIDGVKDGSITSEINPSHLTMSLWGMTVGVLQLIKVKGSVMKDSLQVLEEDLLESYINIFAKGIKKI